MHACRRQPSFFLFRSVVVTRPAVAHPSSSYTHTHTHYIPHHSALASGKIALFFPPVYAFRCLLCLGAAAAAAAASASSPPSAGGKGRGCRPKPRRSRWRKGRSMESTAGARPVWRGLCVCGGRRGKGVDENWLVGLANPPQIHPFTTPACPRQIIISTPHRHPPTPTHQHTHTGA
jgi:hypothetical protein